MIRAFAWCCLVVWTAACGSVLSPEDDDPGDGPDADVDADADGDADSDTDSDTSSGTGTTSGSGTGTTTEPCAGVSNGEPCTGGTCYDGRCCTGCWDAMAGVCQTGNTNTYCGVTGRDCVTCSGTCTKDPVCTGMGDAGTGGTKYVETECSSGACSASAAYVCCLTDACSPSSGCGN